MPRYLAINEIKTVLTFGREAYHPVSNCIKEINFVNLIL